MTMPPPARVGDSIEEVDTPALILDLDAFERNLRTMARLAEGYGVRLRPHAKTHKSPVIALKQMAHGAVGQCCQKVSEAEILVAGGVTDVLVSNEVVAASKLSRLAALARHAKITVCADDAGVVAALNDAAARFDVDLGVLVEVDVGAGRCGVAPGGPAAALAEAIERASHLRFAGLQAYHGGAQHVRGHRERGAVIAKAGDAVRVTLDALAKAGIACPIVTGAGTGSFEFEATSGLWGEIQCGSYVFMDADYGRNLGADGEHVAAFENSLFVLAQVMSRPRPDRAVIDAGHKAAAIDSGLPQVADLVDVSYAGASDEHGNLVLGAGAPKLAIGDRVRLIPGHCDPTVNLHDWYVGVRRGRVEALWPVAARGALF